MTQDYLPDLAQRARDDSQLAFRQGLGQTELTIYTCLSNVLERQADRRRELYQQFHLLKLKGYTRQMVRKGILYQPQMAEKSEAELENMQNELFSPGDLTQLKSTIRRITLDLHEVGYRAEGPVLKYDTIDTIAKIVTKAATLEKAMLGGPVSKKTDRRIVW